MTAEEALEFIEENSIHHQDIYTGWSEIIEFFDKAKEALEKQIPKKMTLKSCTEKTIIACPDCGVNLAIAYYNEDGKISGMQCMGDVPPIARYCRFCGKKFPKDWSEEE